MNTVHVKLGKHSMFYCSFDFIKSKVNTYFGDFFIYFFLILRFKLQLLEVFFLNLVNLYENYLTLRQKANFNLWINIFKEFLVLMSFSCFVGNPVFSIPTLLENLWSVSYIFWTNVGALALWDIFQFVR